MKNLQTILIAVLIVCVAVLFYLQFSRGGRSSGETNSGDITTNLGSTGSLKIAWLNSDSLWGNYSFVDKKREELELFHQKLEAQYKATVKSFEQEYVNLEREFNEYIQKGSAGAYSLEQQKAKEEDFARRKAKLDEKQTTIVQLDQEYSLQVADQEQRMNRELQDTIVAFLKRFNAERNFTFIFAFASGGNLLVANDSLDITKWVIQGLNEEYNQRKEK
ncbi:MAG: OmpH family outer membrane protein [Bacteroidetes bacterium]|nr:OmpH family outer membrane protein [Bacteroidota bacterium]MBU1718786.1 OmpH family outer membrane protein [Bacteroidota bacterium]